MWRRMMRVWLVGATVTAGCLDGLPATRTGELMLAPDTRADSVRELAVDSGRDADLREDTRQGIRT